MTAMKARTGDPLAMHCRVADFAALPVPPVMIEAAIVVVVSSDDNGLDHEPSALKAGYRAIAALRSRGRPCPGYDAAAINDDRRNLQWGSALSNPLKLKARHEGDVPHEISRFETILEAELGNLLKKQLKGCLQFKARQMHSEALVDASAQCDMRRLAIETHLRGLIVDLGVLIDDRRTDRHVLARHDLLPVNFQFARCDAERRDRTVDAKELLDRQYDAVRVFAQFLLLLRMPCKMGKNVAQHCRDGIQTAQKQIETMAEDLPVIPLAAVFNLEIENLGYVVVARIVAPILNLLLQVIHNLSHGIATHFPVVGMQHLLFPDQELGQALLRQAKKVEHDENRIAFGKFIDEVTVARLV